MPKKSAHGAENLCGKVNHAETRRREKFENSGRQIPAEPIPLKMLGESPKV